MSSISTWIEFFHGAGFDECHASRFAIIFVENRIRSELLADLNHDYLKDMGLLALGDRIAILKHAKKMLEGTVEENRPDIGGDATPAVNVNIASSAQLAPSQLTNSSPDPIRRNPDVNNCHETNHHILPSDKKSDPVPMVEVVKVEEEFDCLELQPADTDGFGSTTEFHAHPSKSFMSGIDTKVLRMDIEDPPSTGRSSLPLTPEKNLSKRDFSVQEPHKKYESMADDERNAVPRVKRTRDCSPITDEELDSNGIPRVKSQVVQVIQPQPQPSSSSGNHLSRSKYSYRKEYDHDDNEDNYQHHLPQPRIDHPPSRNGRSSSNSSRKSDHSHSSSNYSNDRNQGHGDRYRHSTLASTSTSSRNYNSDSSQRGRHSEEYDHTYKSHNYNNHTPVGRDMNDRWSFGDPDSARSYASRNSKYEAWRQERGIPRAECGRDYNYQDDYDRPSYNSHDAVPRDKDLSPRYRPGGAVSRNSEPPPPHEQRSPISRYSSDAPSECEPPQYDGNAGVAGEAAPPDGSQMYETLESRYKCKSEKISRNYDGPSKILPSYFL